MQWIKDIIVDILVTAFIVATALVQLEWMRWIVIGYTGIMLLAKTIVYFSETSLQLVKKAKTDAPEWITHALYAINTGVMLSIQWWFVGLGWILIWLASYGAQRKISGARS
ncbi:MAG: hypothetical protein R3211_04040 [Balneolaceae bacterium]|nr:hypothetical protein [Balneolaceae bacterium]